jgi:DNA-directed RNA polymerase subunit E'/Rpb7
MRKNSKIANKNKAWVLKVKKKKKKILVRNTKMILKLIDNVKMEEKMMNNRMITTMKEDSTKVAWITKESNLKKKPKYLSVALKNLWLIWLNI